MGFGSAGVAALGTDVYARSVGLLFVVLVLTFLFNLGSGIAGFGTLTKLGLGYQFRTGSALDAT